MWSNQTAAWWIAPPMIRARLPVLLKNRFGRELKISLQNFSRVRNRHGKIGPHPLKVSPPEPTFTPDLSDHITDRYVKDFVEGHLRLHDTRYWLFRAVGGHLARPTVPILCRVFYPNGTVPVLTGTRSNLPLLGGNEIHYISGLTARGIHHIISPEMFFLGVSAPTLVREDEEYYEEYYQYYRSLFRYPDSVRSNLADPSFNGFGSDPRIAALRERLLLSAASDLYNRRFLPELGYPWRPQYLDLARPDPRDDPPGHAEFMETLRNIHTPRPLFDNKESKTSDMVTKILAWCHENNRTFLDLAEGNDPNGEISTLLPELDGLIEFFDWTTMTFGEAKTLYRLLCHLRDRDQVVADRLFDDFHEAGQYLQGYYSSTMGNVGVVQFYITKYRMRKHLKEVFTRARNALLLALTDRRRFARQPPRDDATRIPWTHLDKLSSD